MAAREKCKKNAILPSQVRAARGLLGWSQGELAKKSGIVQRTIVRIEREEGIVRDSSLWAVQDALETAGVEFISADGKMPGVRFKEI